MKISSDGGENKNSMDTGVFLVAGDGLGLIKLGEPVCHTDYWT